MKQTQRHDEILDLVRHKGYVSTDDLVAHFEVSPQTIRRDLNELATENKIRRQHGGATLPSSSVNAAYNARKTMQQEAKNRLAEALVAHIPDGSTLFLDIGTTPEAVARALLNHQDLRIVTNNLNAASILMAKDDFRIIMAGGEVRNRDGGIIGEATVDFVSQFRLDYGILGISGIDYDGSLLDFDYHEVRVKQAIMENSRSVLLAADHTKFGRNAMVNVGSLTQIDHLFVDAPLPEGLQLLVEESGTQVELINMSI